ncbi:PP0621 family protein [Thiolinea disciformis]|uniref:PP0621 family protein n=1 Tax=Thiolinea disciformis TaxID=125614 RepID=UPI003CCBC1DF
MPRILFILVLLAVGYLLLRSWQRKKNLYQIKVSGRLKKTTRIVRCAQCGLHVPEAEAVQYGGKSFCSLEHAQQAQYTVSPMPNKGS